MVPTNLPLTHKEWSNDPQEYSKITYSASCLSAPPPGRCQKARGRQKDGERERGPQSSDKKVRNGQRWMDFQHYIMKTYLLFSIQTPHALTHCSLHRLSSPWRYLSHPLLLSHKVFSAEPCRCSPSHRWPNHILTLQQTSLIIILGVNELRSSLNWVYLSNQIGPIKTKLLLTLAIVLLDVFILFMWCILFCLGRLYVQTCRNLSPAWCNIMDRLRGAWCKTGHMFAY